MLTKLEMLNLLKREVVPALGCTEPMAVALAAATAKSKIAGEVKSIVVKVSPNIYKNGMAVGIPGVSVVGLDVAAALGAMAGNPDLKLEVLSNLSPDSIKKALDFLKTGRITSEIDYNNGNLYVAVTVISDMGKGKCEIRNRHDDICTVEVNEEIIYQSDKNDSIEVKNTHGLLQMSIKDIIEEVEAIPYDDLMFLLDGAKMNKAIATVGLEKALGMGVGASIKRKIDQGIIANDVMQQSVLLTAAASDARMSGHQMPVMSSAGSGNHGLTAILPVVSVAEYFKKTEEELVRALAISHLITIYIKGYTGSLSALCGCAVAAATGASVAIVWLLGGEVRQMEGTIKNMVADVTGVICDGAKTGCAFKLSTAALVALKSALLALDDVIATPDNGIVAETCEQTIKNLGRIGTPGMVLTDREILDVMMEKNKFKLSQELC